MRVPISILCILGLISSVAGQSLHCLSDRYSQDALFDSTDIQIIPDVHYATSVRWPGAETDSLEMDIYMPNQNIDPLSVRPLIVMTHGGSFAAGTRQAMAFECMEMARRGFVTATITYRLGWNCDFSTDPCLICQGEAWRAKVATYRAVQDNRAAIRHLVQNATELGIDTSYIFLQGESAGSITSLNSAFWDQDEADAWCANCKENVGELDTAGNDIAIPYTIKGVVNHCGAVSNLDVMNDHQIPVISFHNDPDCVVPYGSGQVMNCLGCAAFYWVSGSNSIQARLNQNGVCTQRHSRQEILPDHCTYYASPLIKKATCFLKGIMCEECTSLNSVNNFSIPDCSEGAPVGINQMEERGLIELNGNRLVIYNNAKISSISIYDLSMRCVHSGMPTISGSYQLPSHIAGCYLIKAESSDNRSQVLKWCN